MTSSSRVVIILLLLLSKEPSGRESRVLKEEKNRAKLTSRKALKRRNRSNCETLYHMVWYHTLPEREDSHLHFEESRAIRERLVRARQASVIGAGRWEISI